MKFIADSMLGRLAKWLRIMGYDCAFVPHNERDRELMLLEARQMGAVLLTRDTTIAKRGHATTVIVFREQHWRDQLRKVIKELDLKPSRELFFSRCTRCNEPLAALSREEALPSVPARTAEHDYPYFRCPSCGKIYWPGTHLAAVEAEISALSG